MAVRKLVICCGQSNTGPWHDLETWLPDRGDLNLLLSSRRVAGATDTQFTIPNSIPGFTGSKSLRGLAVRTLRYFVLYNPVATGYSSYPGTGRVAPFSSLPNGLLNTSTDIIVEQRFKTGANGVASITRRMTGTVHTVSAVTEMTKTFVDAAVNTGTNRINVVGHGFVATNTVRLMSTGALPAGLSSLTLYYIRFVDADNFELALTSGGAAVDITGAAGGGTHTIMHASSASATEPATVGSILTVTPAFDPPPASSEEFTYEHKANANGTQTTAILSQHYGLLRNGDLRSLRLRCINGTAGNIGQSRSISGWDDVTLTVTVSTAFTSNTAAGDTFAIEPITGVAFDRYGMWLPWTMFERDLNANAVFGELSKTNPYPPGFDFPSHWHLPQMYGASNQPVTTTQNLNLTIGANIAWHVGGMVRMSEMLGEEVWCLACDFGGSSTAHREFELGTRGIAWYDPAQQNHWSLAATNGCFQRLLDEIDAAIAAAALVGDTLQLVGIFRSQADADASIGVHGYTTSGSGVVGMPVWRAKFLDSNRALRTRLRQELKTRNLWPKEAYKIPWSQKLLSLDTVDQTDEDPTSAQEINTALMQLSDEDKYADSWDPTGLDLWDGIHYYGYELDTIERKWIESYLHIVNTTDQTGAVDICNLALSHIGEYSRIVSIDPPDNTTVSALSAKFYPMARRQILESHNWGFAMRRRVLNTTYSETTNWAFCYVAPGDMVRPVSILPPDAGNDYTGLVPQQAQFYEADAVLSTGGPRLTQDYQMEQRLDGTLVIYTNQEDAVLRYVGDVEDSRRYTQLFTEAVSWCLASKLAGPIIKGDQGAAEAKRCYAMMQGVLSVAKQMDSQSRQIRPEHKHPFGRG